MSSSLGLKSFQRDDDRYDTVRFEGQHSQGGAGGTTLSFDVVLRRFRAHPMWTATLEFDGCEAETVEEALTRLSQWAARAAETLGEAKKRRDNGEGDSLPLGDWVW